MIHAPAPRRPERTARRHGLLAPLVVFALILTGWTGWWFWLSSQVQSRLDLQAEALRQAGWTVRYQAAGPGGWPFRVRLQLNELSIGAPSGHRIDASWLVAQAEAWNPDKWVLVAPDGLGLTRPGQGRTDIRGQAVRASVHGLTQRWPNVAIELARPEFTPVAGAAPFPIARADRVEFYARPHRVVSAQTPQPDAVDVFFRMIDAEGRASGPVDGMTRQGRLTAQIETTIEHADQLRGADAAGVFSAWTRNGGRFSRLRGEAQAGDSKATLASEGLMARPDGRLEGRLALSAAQPMPALAGLAGSNSGAVNRVGAAGAAAAAAVAPRAGDGVELTLEFRDGRTYLGPFPLAPAPKLF